MNQTNENCCVIFTLVFTYVDPTLSCKVFVFSQQKLKGRPFIRKSLLELKVLGSPPDFLKNILLWFYFYGQFPKTFLTQSCVSFIFLLPKTWRQDFAKNISQHSLLGKGCGQGGTGASLQVSGSQAFCNLRSLLKVIEAC